MITIYLYDLLQSRGWTQRRLAQDTNIREATISDMCNNRISRIRVKNLDRICKALNCRVEDIIEYTPDN